jgi:hypothetical protein
MEGRTAPAGGAGRVTAADCPGRDIAGGCTPPKLGRCIGCGRDTFGMLGRVAGI